MNLNDTEMKIFINNSGLGESFFCFEKYCDDNNLPDPSFASGLPSPQPRTLFYNNVATLNEDENMMDFALEELEALLESNNIQTYLPMDVNLNFTPVKIEALLSNNLMPESPTEIKAETSVSPEQLYECAEENNWVEGPEVEVLEEQQPPTSPQDKSFLLIKIPESLQSSSTFDSLPSIHLKPNIIREINKASAGHDGVYLSIPELVPKNVVNIIRRKPLQIIQTIVPVSKVKPRVEVKAHKRKQQFNLTREDGVMFLGDSPEPKLKLPRFDDDDWFSTLIPRAKAREEIKKLEIDESNRCQGCKKVFKNLANHKCKKFEKPVEKEPMTCASCNKKYKSKSGLLNHFKKCDQSKVFEDKPYENSETEDAVEENVEALEAVTPKKTSTINIISVEVIKQERLEKQGFDNTDGYLVKKEKVQEADNEEVAIETQTPMEVDKNVQSKVCIKGQKRKGGKQKIETTEKKPKVESPELQTPEKQEVDHHSTPRRKRQSGRNYLYARKPMTRLTTKIETLTKDLAFYHDDAMDTIDEFAVHQEHVPGDNIEEVPMLETKNNPKVSVKRLKKAFGKKMTGKKQKNALPKTPKAIKSSGTPVKYSTPSTSKQALCSQRIKMLTRSTKKLQI